MVYFFSDTTGIADQLIVDFSSKWMEWPHDNFFNE